MKFKTGCSDSLSTETLRARSALKQQWSLAELSHTLAATSQTGLPGASGPKRQQYRAKGCFLPLICENWELPESEHAEGTGREAREEDGSGEARGTAAGDGGRRLGPAGREEPQEPGWRVLTERREAPSGARIAAALTAGIAAAPLTHAGSRDTAAPC